MMSQLHPKALPIDNCSVYCHPDHGHVDMKEEMLVPLAQLA